MFDTTIWSFCPECVQFIIISYLYRDINYIYIGGAVANRLRRRTSDQTVLGSNPAVAAALSPWTRLFTPIVPRRSLHISFYLLSGHPCKIYTGKKKKKLLWKRKFSSSIPLCVYHTTVLRISFVLLTLFPALEYSFTNTGMWKTLKNIFWRSAGFLIRGITAKLCIQ